MKLSPLCLIALPCLAYGELIDTSTRTIATQADTPTLASDTALDNPPTAHPNATWLDTQRKHTKAWLNHTAHRLDDWFGTPNPNKPANASLRFMVDVYDNKYDGTSIRPKVRGRLKLPALENRLSLIIGDESLEHYDEVGWRVDLDNPTKRFDRQKAKDNNSSLALRFSKWRAENGIETDADIGTRSGGEIYGRLRAEKTWQHTDDTTSRLEQIYRYGSKTEHFLRTNYTLTKVQSDTHALTNHTYLEYRHDKDEIIVLGNKLYQTHTYPAYLGEKVLSYGINAYARIDENSYPNSYGAFINYRQPIWRNWLFVQGELNYYNDKLGHKDHHLASFVRFETLF